MTSVPRQREARGLFWWLPTASLGMLGFGLLFLGAYCVAEMLANPGSSLIDAYWRGRLPWMGIAETLIVVGATACGITGAATVFWLGGLDRRALAIPALLAVALWWFTAVALSMMRATPCAVGEPCPTPAPDPWAFAYSAPQPTAGFLILPAVLVALLAVTAARGDGPGDAG